MPRDIIINSFKEAQDCLSYALSDKNLQKNIILASEVLCKAFDAGYKVISCGNGGSMSDAMHFAEELSGKFRDERKALPAVAISDPGHLTCSANDFGYHRVFSRYLEAHLKKGDVLLAISTSGNSANILEAAKYAKSVGSEVISLTGNGGSVLAEISDINLTIYGSKSKWADRIQEMHIKIIHIIIELVEKKLFYS